MAYGWGGVGRLERLIYGGSFPLRAHTDSKVVLAILKMEREEQRLLTYLEQRAPLRSLLFAP